VGKTGKKKVVKNDEKCTKNDKKLTKMRAF